MFDFQLPQSALPLTSAYLRATLAGNHGEALRLALDEGLAEGVSPSALQLRMILPAQREVGRLWQENVISVAQEHLATAVSQLVLSHLYPHLPRPDCNGRRVIVACVEGELHDMGARMGADFLEMAGFEVQFLGASVANERLVAAITDEQPALLGLSATMHFHAPALREAVKAARTVAPLLPIVVGGGICEAMPSLERELDVQAAGGSAEELAALCRKLAGCEEVDDG